MAAKSVVILGGGTGGLVAASRLRRMLDKEHYVILVSRSPIYTFEPGLTRVMLGERKVNRISRDLRKLEKKGIKVVISEVVGLDPANKRVMFPDGGIEYDYLVISLGADYSAQEVPGLHRARTFYHPDGAEGMNEALGEFTSGRIAVAIPSLPYKCPAAPYEGALLLDHHFRKRRLRDDVEIHVYTPEASPLGAAGPEAGERVVGMLGNRDIGFTGGVQMKSVNHEKGLINFHDREPQPFDLLIATPVHSAPYPLENSGLLGEDGWIAVDRETFATAAPDVYAIGDCTSVEIANGQKLPKAGVFAHGEAEVVARNITAEIAGKDPIWAYGGQGSCFMEVGGGKGAYITGDFYEDPVNVDFRGPGRTWHWAKNGFERLWLWRWF